MSFDLKEIVRDDAYWRKLVKKFGNRIVEEGWEGSLDEAGLENDKNWDALDNVLRTLLSEIATEEAFEESEGGGISGSADFASIWNLEGRYFVTGSYLDAGPCDSYQEAADAAGI